VSVGERKERGRIYLLFVFITKKRRLSVFVLLIVV